MRHWITTDTHLGHKNIQKYCNRPANCDNLILQGLSVLEAGDILIHLGDVAFNNYGEELYLATIPEGVTKWLVLGNHDRKPNYHLNLGWDWVGLSMRMKRYGQVIQFSHKPIPTYNCDVQIHGHFHNNSSKYWEGELKQVIDSKHRLLILEDVEYKPVLLEKVILKEYLTKL